MFGFQSLGFQTIPRCTEQKYHWRNSESQENWAGRDFWRWSGPALPAQCQLSWVKVETRGGKQLKNKKHVPGSSCQGNPGPVCVPNPVHDVWALTSLMSPTPNLLSQGKGILMGSLIWFSYSLPFLLSLQIK